MRSGSVTSHWIAAAAMAFGDGLQRFQPPAEQRQLRAAALRCSRGGGADARASAGDQRVASGKRSSAHLSPSRQLGRNAFEVARRAP